MGFFDGFGAFAGGGGSAPAPVPAPNWTNGGLLGGLFSGGGGGGGGGGGSHPWAVQPSPPPTPGGPHPWSHEAQGQSERERAGAAGMPWQDPFGNWQIPDSPGSRVDPFTGQWQVSAPPDEVGTVRNDGGGNGGTFTTRREPPKLTPGPLAQGPVRAPPALSYGGVSQRTTAPRTGWR